MKMNKRAFSMSGWAEVAIFCSLFIIVLTIISINMNGLYGKNYDGSFGLATNDTMSDYKIYQESLQSSIKTGEQQQNTITGVQITSTWNMIKLGAETTFNFITGRWIENVVGMMRLGDIQSPVAIAFRVLYMISIGFIAIRLLMKVNP